MEYIIQSTDGFEVSLQEQQIQEEIKIVHLVAATKGVAQKLQLTINWKIPNIGIHSTWSPTNYKNKEIVPDWGYFETSCAMSSAPVFSDVSYDDKNKQTIACSDAKNTVQMHTGVIEESGELDCVVKIHVDYSVSHYEVDVRIDTRDIPFYKAIDDVRIWWEQYDGYLPASVPDAAYDPVYSTWYSFHQNIDVKKIVEECKTFAALGCKTVIVDDGWQTDNTERGYDYCGDWRPTHTKVPDMKGFVDEVHDLGMKFMLWYSVPYVGAYSEAYQKFKDKMLCRREDDGQTYVVDPRYPEIRDYLIDLYKNAVLDWGLDGFKLDFVDSFKQSDVVKEGMDYVSVYDAVDRLLKDVTKTLQDLKPDILIEFRQSYMGPLMRTFGNMIRSFDCPNDSWSNCMNTLALRMTCGETAVHSDMVMWNKNEPVELAAFQLTRALFAVPQISIKNVSMTKEHMDMVERYLKLWMNYQDTILSGEMTYKGYSNNYLYVSACDENRQVGVVYAGQMAYVENMTDEIVIFNSSMNDKVLFDTKATRKYAYTVYDCCGKELQKEIVNLENMTLISQVPINGTIILTAL